MERQPEIWARPAACTSSQQQYKHLPKNWSQPCLRDEVKGEVCADISWGCSFHPRDYLCPQDHRCHPVGESRAKSAHAVWKLRCRESSSRQNKAKSGDRASRELLLCSQGVGGLQALGPQLGLFPVSSPPPGQIWAPAGLLQQSPGQASDISHCSVTPEGLSGPAQAQDREEIAAQMPTQTFRSQKPCSYCALVIFLQCSPLLLDSGSSRCVARSWAGVSYSVPKGSPQPTQTT